MAFFLRAFACSFARARLSPSMSPQRDIVPVSLNGCSYRGMYSLGDISTILFIEMHYRGFGANVDAELRPLPKNSFNT